MTYWTRPFQLPFLALAKNRSRLGSENREWMKLAHLPLKSAVAGGGLLPQIFVSPE